MNLLTFKKELIKASNIAGKVINRTGNKLDKEYKEDLLQVKEILDKALSDLENEK